METNRIRGLREDNDMSQKQVAEYLNISQRAYSHYEVGSRAISVDLLMKLADLYKVSLDYLVCRAEKRDI
ncbi:MAG: helix-turn-helix transcriptional regulator [Erysipelotrichaceae bacterium]